MIDKETLEYAEDKIDDALIALVPRMSDKDIIDLVNRRLEEARESYGDFLSMPDV